MATLLCEYARVLLGGGRVRSAWNRGVVSWALNNAVLKEVDNLLLAVS